MPNRRSLIALAGTAVLAFGLLPPQALAETYPSRPIRVIVAQAPGGTADIMARLVGERLAKRIGQPVVIENKTGAGGILGTELAARAEPDGYTLYLSTGAPLGIIPNIKAVNYDPVKDFAHITLSATLPLVLAVHPDVPATSVRELIAFAKGNPGKLNFASSGHGSVTQLSGELFKTMAKVDLVHIPFRGSAMSTAAVLGGQVQLAFADSSILQHAQAGKLRALAVTTAQRTAIAPEIPTMDEAGLPGYASYAWLGFSAPAGTPQPIIDRLYAEMKAVMETPDVREKLIARGMEPSATTPAAFTAYVAEELKKWKDLIEGSGLKFD